MKYKPFAIYLDNLAVHRANAVRDLCKKYQIYLIYGVSYSPDLNAIESVFGYVKDVFKRERLHKMVNGQPFDMNSEIRSAFAQVTTDMVLAQQKRSIGMLHKPYR